MVHLRSSSRLTPDPLKAGLFRRRSPPRRLTGAAYGGLVSPPAGRHRRAKASITRTAPQSAETIFYIRPTSYVRGTLRSPGVIERVADTRPDLDVLVGFEAGEVDEGVSFHGSSRSDLIRSANLTVNALSGRRAFAGLFINDAQSLSALEAER